MALKKFIFPLDLRGDRASNRVEENHTIGTQQYRAFALKNGPFYTKDLAIRERNTGRVLKRGDDYECVFFYEDLTALTPGKEICGVIVVHNTAISTDITVNANIVGGPFAQSAEAIKEAIDALEINNKNTYWQNVIDKPDLFQPTPHMHDFGDIFGLEFMIDVLGHIRDTLLIGDNAQFEQVRERIDALEQQLRQLHQEHLDDKDNPHQTTAEQVNCYDKQAIDNFLQGINQDFADLEPRLRSLVNGISDINGRIDGLVQALNNTNLQLNQNAQSLSRVHQQIAEINTEIDDLNDHIKRIDNEITGLKQRDQELQAAIDQTNQNLSTTDQNVAKNRSDLEELEEKLNEGTDALDQRVTKAEQDINDIKDDVKDAVHWPSVNKNRTGWSASINKIPYVDGSGVTRIGRYLDFVESATASGYAARLYSNNGVLTFGGNASVNDIYIRSDERYKDLVGKIDGDKANRILKEIGYGYEYTMKAGDDTVYAGLIAQHVEKAYPKATASIKEDDCEEERLRVLPYAMIALLVSGYNHQADEIERQGRIIKILAKKAGVNLEEL